MYLVAIAWMYVVVMMAVAEALSPQGSVLGAFFTLLLYGVLPVVVLLYIMGAPHRRRARLAAERAAPETVPPDAAPPPQPAAAPGVGASAGAPPDGGGEAPGDAVAPVRKEA